MQESGYHPQVEQISPTGPEAPIERDEQHKSTKDVLLQKITKVDREIAKAESVMAKLKKKQSELEDAANKGEDAAASAGGLSEEERRRKKAKEEEEERPKSVAQVVYAENRVKFDDL